MTSTPNQETPLDPTTHATMLRTLLDTLPHHPGATPAEIGLSRQAVAIFVAALQLRDPAEAMLAARYATLHYAMMDMFRRAAQPNLSDAMVLRILGRAVPLARLVEKAGDALAALQKRKPVQVPAPMVAEAPSKAAERATAELPLAEEPAGETAAAPAETPTPPAQPEPGSDKPATGREPGPVKRSPGTTTIPRTDAGLPLRARLATSTSFSAVLSRPLRSAPAVRVPATCAA